jgi:hypothetical protein
MLETLVTVALVIFIAEKATAYIGPVKDTGTKVATSERAKKARNWLADKLATE